MKGIDFKTLSTLNILYVEDEGGIREKMMLNIDGIFKSITLAVDGLDGIEKFKTNDIDIIVTDIKMPNLDGLEMISQIKQIRNVPCIITTAFNEVEFLNKAISNGVDGYICKPINIKEFLQTVIRASHKVLKERYELELKEINQNLEKKVAHKVEELRIKDKLIEKQSKYAQMGLMIDSIAHQIKSPLSIVALIAYKISSEYLEDSEIDMNFLDEIYNKLTHQVDHINSTVNEFREFFRDRDAKEINLYSLVKSTEVLVEDEFKHKNIKIINNVDENIIIDGFANDIKHILLNIFNNARDVFKEREVKDATITVTSTDINHGSILSIKDNAGGIDKDTIDKIFDLEFTTKQTLGTGLGLYLCKMLIEKIDGDIWVENSSNGAEFKIKFKRI